MTLHAAVVSAARPLLRAHPGLKGRFADLDSRLTMWQHSAARSFPRLIRPQPRVLMVAITAKCNLRCAGCRYGRDFMPGHQLPLQTVYTLLGDAREAGFETVRLYGGEPLLHPDLPAMVSRAADLGVKPYVTTNGALLKEKIDSLYQAGLRALTLGFYGIGARYDLYAGRPGAFARLESGVASVRERYGDAVAMQMNFLLAPSSCNVGDVQDAWEFARRYHLKFQVDIAHYSLPYFTGAERPDLQFTPADRDRLAVVACELERLRAADPERYPESVASIRSIPDWAAKGRAMRVPCTAYRLIWVGADGTVQLCYVTFKLGNLFETRLRDLLFTGAHSRAARSAFALDCPNCHCERDDRIRADAASLRLYSIAPVRAPEGRPGIAAGARPAAEARG